MVKRVLLLVIMFCSASFLSGTSSWAGPATKPLPPVKISIQPVQPDVSSATILPGDTISFRITAMTFIEARELRVKVELSDGTELVSGQTTWAGPASKNEEKVLILTVRAPQKGVGKISVHAVLPGTAGASFAAESWYLLGAEPNKKASVFDARPNVKKDGKGRDVIEYR